MNFITLMVFIYLAVNTIECKVNVEDIAMYYIIRYIWKSELGDDASGSNLIIGCEVSVSSKSDIDICPSLMQSHFQHTYSSSSFSDYWNSKIYTYL